MQIDIGVTVHNRPQSTKVFFDSILNCLNSDYRLFIFDDASDQESQDLIEDYCKKYPHFINLRSDKNIGNVFAKRTLLETMESKYIVQTDNDIILSKHSPDILQKQTAILDKYPDVTCVVPRMPDVDVGPPRKIVLDQGKEVYPGLWWIRMYGAVFQMQKRENLIKVGAYILPTRNKWDSYEQNLAKKLRGKSMRFKYVLMKDVWVQLQDTNCNCGYEEEDPHGIGTSLYSKFLYRCVTSDPTTLEPLWHKEKATNWWRNPKYYKFQGGKSV